MEDVERFLHVAEVGAEGADGEAQGEAAVELGGVRGGWLKLLA